VNFGHHNPLVALSPTYFCEDKPPFNAQVPFKWILLSCRYLPSLSSPRVVNYQNQSIFQDVGCHFNDHTTIDSHFESSHNDFNFQEINSIHIYDSVPFVHYLELLTQVNASFNIDHIISANTCAKEILVDKSFMSCNNNENSFPIVNNANFSQKGEQITFTIMFSFQQFHNDFQDIIEIWLENSFLMRFPVNKFILLISIRSRCI
jgi:hypothetical protein